jgi:hypothetical protein
MLDFIIRRSSAAVATLCNRVFAKESVIETFREIDTPRLFLDRYPITNVAAISAQGATVDPTTYDLDTHSGRLMTISGAKWLAPVQVTYTAGYELPFESPPDLRQAALLMIRDEYWSAQRGDSNIRMIAHKESRVIYYDPVRKGMGSSPSGPSQQVRDLLSSYTKYV